jgi:hypothetical protein
MSPSPMVIFPERSTTVTFPWCLAFAFIPSSA